jgi:hypothetical protein
MSKRTQDHPWTVCICGYNRGAKLWLAGTRRNFSESTQDGHVALGRATPHHLARDWLWLDTCYTININQGKQPKSRSRTSIDKPEGSRCKSRLEGTGHHFHSHQTKFDCQRGRKPYGLSRIRWKSFVPWPRADYQRSEWNALHRLDSPLSAQWTILGARSTSDFSISSVRPQPPCARCQCSRVRYRQLLESVIG